MWRIYYKTKWGWELDPREDNSFETRAEAIAAINQMVADNVFPTTRPGDVDAFEEDSDFF